MHNVGFRSQEKSYIDEKITEVQKTVALMASDNGERERREEMREEFRRLNTTVQSVKEVLDKNEDKIGEIVMKVENLVSVGVSQVVCPPFTSQSARCSSKEGYSYLVKLSECIFQKKGEAGLQSSALTYNLGKCLMIEIPPAHITDTPGEGYLSDNAHTV